MVASEEGSFALALDSAGEVRIAYKAAFSLLELIRGVPGGPWSTELTTLDSKGASIFIDSKGRTQLALGVDGQLALASFPCE